MSYVGCLQFKNHKTGQIAFSRTAHSDQNRSSRNVDGKSKQAFCTQNHFWKFISSIISIVVFTVLILDNRNVLDKVKRNINADKSVKRRN
jgi:hypothetical protein